jgi:hypothetical protein
MQRAERASEEVVGEAQHALRRTVDKAVLDSRHSVQGAAVGALWTRRLKIFAMIGLIALCVGAIMVARTSLM